MKNVFALGVCFAVLAVAAFAAGPAPTLVAPTALGGAPGGGGGHGNTDGVLVDHLATSSGQITNGFSATTATSRWLAVDYTPTSSVRLEKVWFHYLYNLSASRKGAIPMRLYSGVNPGSGSMVASWTVATSAWTETRTTFVAFGRPVFLGEVPIPPQTLSGSTRYWVAYQMTSTDNVFWAVGTTLVGEMIWWYLNSRWGSSSTHGQGTAEGFYKLEGTLTGVEPVSLGKVKTLFK
ncbi:MAG: hypothetical protein V3W11_06800 [bacterium]